MRATIGFLMTLMTTPAIASDCFQFVERSTPQQTIRVSLSLKTLGNVALSRTQNIAFELKNREVGIRFIAHSTYLIETDEGLQILTDWSGHFSYKIDEVPDVITMNHAHETHWTPFPDPKIKHALKGWGSGGKPAEHYLELDASLIRNVPTDIRSFGGEPYGNSIFIFEHGGLCIGHLGHLHHEPTEEQYAAIGRLDVVMAAVDGGTTLDTASMLRVLKRLRARVVLPMHAFGSFTLAQFLDGMKADYEIVYDKDDEIVISAARLPNVPTVIVPKGL